MRANVAQLQAYLSESSDITYHFPEYTHNVCMLQMSTRTQTHTHSCGLYIRIQSQMCIHHHIYLPQEIHGDRPNICICAMNESIVFRHYCEVTLIVLMETSARSMQRLLCTVARPFLHLCPLHDGVVEGQRFAEP